MTEILELYESNPQLSLYIVIGVIAGIILLAILLRIWVKAATRRRIKAAIKSMGGQAIENLKLADGVESRVQVDFCVYSKGQVFVLNIQDYPGIIFGGEKIELWTQLYEGKSYKFTNPLYYNQLCTQVVREQLPGLPVVGRVVFTHHGEFPKGIPEGVSRLDDLAKDLVQGKKTREENQTHQTLWQEFVQDLGQNKETRIHKMKPVTH
jgi:hypothetical protein